MISSPLYKKLFIIITLFILGFCLSLYLFTVPNIRRSVYRIEENASRTILDSVYELVRSKHLSLEAYEKFALDAHKKRLKNIVDLEEALIMDSFTKAAKGLIKEEVAKREILSTIKTLRYGNNNYVWVTDYQGNILSHPDPELHNRNLLGLEDIQGKRFFEMLIRIAREKGDGYTTYWWRRLGQEKSIEKLTYSRDFPQWGWVLMTGVYIDDVKKELAARKKKMIGELRETMKGIKIAGTGYMYIFDTDFNMLIHPNPNIENTDFSELPDPATGRPLSRELMEAAAAPHNKLYYKWDKPDDKGNYIYDKISWVRYFKGLGWFIASSVYTGELNVGAVRLKNNIFRLTGVLFIVALIAAALLLDRVLAPIRKLSRMATNIKEGDLLVRSNIESDDEIGYLAASMNDMVDQLRDSMGLLDEKVKRRTMELDRKNIRLENEIIERKWAEAKTRTLNLELESRVKERTKELENSLKEQKEMQEQLVLSEKMAALGVLVAGVAHEINTPVGNGITGASFINEKFEELEEAIRTEALRRSDLDLFVERTSRVNKMVLSDLSRAAELVRNFKQVAVDHAVEERREFAVCDYLREIIGNLYPTYDKGKHRVELNCPGDITLDSFPGAFAQILTNLVVNSVIHGFGERKKGRITIGVKEEGENLLLRYTDNGKGMDDSILKRLYDPFFTTNRSSGGTGLGMHIVYNLVTQTLRGTIECTSSKGKGVVFLITLPFDPGSSPDPIESRVETEEPGPAR